MSFLNDVLEQYQHTLSNQGLRSRMMNRENADVCAWISKNCFFFFLD